MTKQNHKTGFLVAAMVFFAIALRVLGKFDILKVPGGILRSLIYIALYIGWGISVSKRIIQVQVRHCLIAVSGLMVFWFVIRSMRYFFITDIGIARQLWYWYYLPMLFIQITVEQKGDSVSVQITNDGKPPETEVVPKGGLLNLYRHIMGCGGTMEIQSKPGFALTVVLPAIQEGRE